MQDDLILLREALEGRSEGFRQLVEKYQRGVFDLAARVLQDDAEAQDVTQETFLRLYQHLPRYKVGHKLSNWLYTIALNLCRNRLRHQKVVRFLSLDFVRPEGDDRDRVLEFPAGGLSVPGQLEEKEAEEIMDRLVKALPETLRMPFLLRYTRSLSDPEIAEILGLSINHVRVQISRAKQRLWDQFGEQWEAGVMPEPARGI